MKVVYPGSFDPITYGHIDLIRRLSKRFGQVYVTILDNKEKDPWFTAGERKAMLAQCLKRYKNVKIETYSGLLIHYLKKRKIPVIIRGLRAISDFDAEFKMSLANKDMAPNTETFFMLTDKKFSFLSSSLVKEIASHGGNVKSFVPATVVTALKKKVATRRKKA